MRLMCLKPDPMFSSVKTQRANGVAELLLLQWPLCWQPAEVAMPVTKRKPN